MLGARLTGGRWVSVFTVVMFGFRLEGAVSAAIYSTCFGTKKYKCFPLRLTANHKSIKHSWVIFLVLIE